MVQGSYPGKARFSGPVKTGTMAHPASCTMGTRPLSQGKVAGAGL